MQHPAHLTGSLWTGTPSTNDTLVCMASGAGQAVIEDDAALADFQGSSGRGLL